MATATLLGDDQTAGAVAALAKMHGLVVDKAEVSVMHRPAPLPTKLLELTEDEWLNQFSNGPKRISKMGG